MNPVRVLIADDSVVFRSQIRSALEGVEGVTVVGTASNGKIALERLTQMQVDLITVDLEMPEMNGLELLVRMRELGHKQKTIVFSSVSKRGAEITLEALRKGASDFVAKPSGEELGDLGSAALQPHEKVRALLLPKIRALMGEFKASSPGVPLVAATPGKPHPFPRVIWELLKPQVIVIGSSTGGPTALERIFQTLKAPVRCPILLAQHMPPVFTASLAERLGQVSGIPAGEAKHGELLQPNRLYVAPGNFHMRLGTHPAGGVRILLDQEPMINSVRPAVDPLFSTAAALFKEKCLAIVLTGMGEDGRAGTLEVKQKGGAVMIQDKESCVVFGMPGAVFSAGSFDKIGNLEEISTTLREKLAA